MCVCDCAWRCKTNVYSCGKQCAQRRLDSGRDKLSKAFTQERERKAYGREVSGREGTKRKKKGDKETRKQETKLLKVHLVVRCMCVGRCLNANAQYHQVLVTEWISLTFSS